MQTRTIQLGLFILLFHGFILAINAEDKARVIEPPYTRQKVLFDFYFADPNEINTALYWVRSLLSPLMAEPYGYVPEELDIKVLIHGSEIVTLAKKNKSKYKDAVARMRYYADFGVQFKVCGLVVDEYGYKPEDFYSFVEIVPSAITELAHWQLKGYAIIQPKILVRSKSIEEIR